MKSALPLCCLLLAGCPESVGQQCPPFAAALGHYSLAFKGQHPANECKLTTTVDGGAADASVTTLLTADDGGVTLATLCAGAGTDGGPLLYLVAGGKDLFSGRLDADGGFSILNTTGAAGGTACLCQVARDEAFVGTLTAAGDGGVTRLSDGGLPSITGLAATLVDHLTTPDTSGCACNLPCDVRYVITGTRL